jgi:hypothetical protein
MKRLLGMESRRERGRVFEERKRRVVGMRDVKPRHRLVLGSGS